MSYFMIFYEPQLWIYGNYGIGFTTLSHWFQSETHGFLGEKCWPVKPWSLLGITGPLMDPLAKHHRCRAPCSTIFKRGLFFVVKDVFQHWSKNQWIAFREIYFWNHGCLQCFHVFLQFFHGFLQLFHGFLQFFHASYQKVEDFPVRQIPIIQFWDTILMKNAKSFWKFPSSIGIYYI